MEALFKGLFGAKPTPSATPSWDDTAFADFAGAPDPSPASIISSAGLSSTAAFPTRTAGLPSPPYTQWYRVWERASLSDFKQEAVIFPFLLLALLVNVWGKRANRRKAKAWASSHAPLLRQEFALVGYGGLATAPSADDVSAQGLLQASRGPGELIAPAELLREVAANEYTTYATGRANAAFADIKLSMLKRYNPGMMLAEYLLGFVFESMQAPAERMEATIYAFDGKEREMAPGWEGQEQRKGSAASSSAYDGFVWAVVHKDKMNQLRTERYDLSLTGTKDSPKLPRWATVMSESAEITDALLTPELAKAVESAGEALEALIITDQPIDQPKKLNEAIPRKRISLAYALPPTNTYAPLLPLFAAFLRLPDTLASAAHFRPEALRNVRATRDDEVRKIRRGDEEEKEEERRGASEKAKKEKREAALAGLGAAEQRKYLDRERERGVKRSQKRRSVKS